MAFSQAQIAGSVLRDDSSLVKYDAYSKSMLLKFKNLTELKRFMGIG
jgi:hypothetical protein